MIVPIAACRDSVVPKSSRPNFFIVGAPKCGTTSLAFWLSCHSRVFLSNPKEPHFFNTDHKRAIEASLREYESLFSGAPEGVKAIGDASTYYLMSDRARASIRAYSPNANIIACIREPVDLAFSLYLQKRSEGLERAASFEQAWRCRHQRARGTATLMDPRAEPMQLAYHRVAAVGSQICDWRAEFGDESILVVPLSHIAAHPELTYRRTLAFLGIEYDGLTEFPKKNPTTALKKNVFYHLLRHALELKRKMGTYRSLGIGARLGQLHQVEIEKPDLSDRLRRELREELSEECEEVMRLERLADGQLATFRMSVRGTRGEK